MPTARSVACICRWKLEQLAGPALRDRWAPRGRAAVERGRAATVRRRRPSRVEGDVARLETRVYLGSQLLRDLDAMSMAHSLEVRVPFVDHELLGEVWPDLGAVSRPDAQQTTAARNTRRWPLPHAAVNRPKQGFTLPFARWMGGELEPFVRSGMAFLARSGWIAAGAPDDTWNAWQRGTMHWSRPWALGVLGEFLRQT